MSPWLEKEISQLGFNVQSSHSTGIIINATYNDCLLLNLYLRTAYHVLYLIKDFSCNSLENLYQLITNISWENIIPNDEVLSVVAQANHPSVKNVMFVNQKVKDAIVDRIKEKTAKRPNSGPDRKNVVINVYWNKNHCWVYLNTSGEKLSNRSYRKIPLQAPLQETLAAGIIIASGYKTNTPFINPMCGSGTLAIEAALIALNKAPGLLRSNYGFQHTKFFDSDQWQKLKKETLLKSRKELVAAIIATDHNPEAIKAAQNNAKAAGVDHLITFKVCDFRDTPIPDEPGTIILNPEYGLRMGEEKSLETVYASIGDFFKTKCSGYTGHIFTGNHKLAKKIGLRPKNKIPFFNGDIECRLLSYEMYRGTRRTNFEK
ncbi:MAG: class I SAM-dependent RNA methyltransferase [Candidatus Omnitrophica bacterium]|nr:class I SAM-dependent RNA methyltransferase [Candidatus Omnitrophota bacterium]